MIFEILLVAATVMSILAIEMKYLLLSVIVLGSFGLVLAIIFFMLSAPDIAITQASVIAAVTTLIFIVTIKKTERFEK